MATDFGDPLGVDYHCITDLDASLTVVTGNTALGQSTARRHITPRGGLFYDRSYGDCIRRFLKASGFTQAQLARVIEHETVKDERVRNTAALVELDPEDVEDITIVERVTPVTGQPFDLTLTVDELGVELLNEDVVA